MLRPLSLSSAREAVAAVEALYEELAEAHAEVTFVEQGDFTDPYAFADAVVNNLPAIQYALAAGLPVTAWGPIKKNPAETDRVLKAIRQWTEQARSLIEQLAAGLITQDQFWSRLVDQYNQQAANAFTAGKRAIGNLAPLNAPQTSALSALTTPDTNALTQMQTNAGSAPLAAGGGVGGALGTMVSGMISPQNFIGSGLPGDPMGMLMGGGKAEKGAANAFSNRIEQYGKSIGSYASAGEMSAFSDLPEEVITVWWELGEADHCVDCIQLADLSPFTLGTLDDSGIFPGSGHTECGSNCACDLMYDAPSEVCGDTLAGPGDLGESAGELGNVQDDTAPQLARPFPFVESNDGRRFNVWVQEASSCDMPMDVGSFGPPADYQVIDDASAFNWNEDVALGMEGEITDAVSLDVALVDDATRTAMGFLPEYLKAGAADEQVASLVFGASGATYKYAFRETPTALIFDFGATTKGLSTLDAEMTVKALAQMAEKAAASGKAVMINSETAGAGMRKWLDTLVTHRTGPGEPIPHVIPKWDFIPPPLAMPVTEKPGLAEAIARVDAFATSPTNVLDGAPMDYLAYSGYWDEKAIPYFADFKGPPNGFVLVTPHAPKNYPGIEDTNTFAFSFDAAGRPTAALRIAPNEQGQLIVVGVVAEDKGKGYGTALYDWVQNNTDVNLFPIIGTGGDLTPEGKAFATKWLTHRQGLPPTMAIPMPAIPDYLIVGKPDLATFVLDNPNAKSALGGLKAKSLYVDGTGRQWLYKPGETEAAAEVAASRIGREIGLPMPEVRLGQLGGKKGSLQAIIPDVHTAGPNVGDLTPEQIRGLSRQHVLDRLIGDDDVNPGNILLAGDGNLITIDTGRSFSGIVRSDFHNYLPKDEHGYWDGIWSIPHQPEKSLAAIHPTDISQVIDAVEAIPEARYRALVKPVAEALAGKSIEFGGPPQTAEQLLARFMARKASIRADMEAIWTQRLTRLRDEKWLGKNGADYIPAEWNTWLKDPHFAPVPEAKVLPVGPPILAENPAAGFKPGDAQQYLVGDSPLPVNAPLAQWSGFVPPEPPLPKEVVAASAAEKAAAQKAATEATPTWHDVALSKVDLAFTRNEADRVAAENAGLVYANVGGIRVVGRDQQAITDMQAWLAVQGHAANTDAFWIEVMGYRPGDLAAIDAYQEMQTGKRFTAGVLMVEPDGRVWVLAPKNEFAGYQNTFIKGGIDSGETPAAAAIREMREEGGFSAELDSYLGDYMNTDKTGVGRMYLGHRTGGGPLTADLKETYKVKLLTKDEATKALTRYKKPDARDQTILADAFERLTGTPTPSHYVIPAAEAEAFGEKIGVVRPLMLHDVPAPAVPGFEHGVHPSGSGFGAVTRHADPAPSAAFAYDPHYVDGIGAHVAEYPASSTKFPLNTSKWSLPDGQVQPMYWKVEDTPAFTVPAASVAPEAMGAQILSTPVVAQELAAAAPAKKVWASTDAMVTDLTARYPQATFLPLTEMPLAQANQFMAEVDRVFSKYGAPPSYRGVKWGTGDMGQTLAEVKRDSPGIPGSSIYIPKPIWGNPDKLAAVFEANKGGNWAVMAHAATLDEFVGSSLVHELGHEYMGLSLTSRFGGKGSPVAKKVDAWFSDYLKSYKTNPLTEYGAKNPHEAWAEAFTAAVGPVQIDDPRINDLRQILADAFPEKAVEVPKVQPFADWFEWPKDKNLKVVPSYPGDTGLGDHRLLEDFNSQQQFMATDLSTMKQADAEARVGGAAIQRALGVRSPDARIYKTNNWLVDAQGTVAKKDVFAQWSIPYASELEDLAKATTNPEVQEHNAVKALTAVQSVETAKAEISNWLIGEGDANFSNFMVDANGHIWSIDHGQALSRGNLTTHFGWNDGSPLGDLGLYAPKKLLADVRPGDLTPLVQTIAGMSDTTLLGLAGPLTDEAKAALLLRRDEAVTRLSQPFADLVAATPSAPKEWKDWLASGGTFGETPKVAIAAPASSGWSLPKVEDLAVGKPTEAAANAANFNPEFAGAEAKVWLTDGKGAAYIFKPKDAAATAKDVAEGDLFAAVGVQTATLKVFAWEGKTGTLSRVVDGSAGLWPPSIDVLEGKPLAVRDMAREQVADYAFAENDLNFGNWVLGPDGHLWAIDRTDAWSPFAPKKALDMSAPIAVILKNADMGPAALSVIHPSDIAEMIARIEAIPEAEYRATLTAHVAPDLVETMVARKAATRQAMADQYSEAIDVLKGKGGTIPPEWEAWRAAGSTFVEAKVAAEAPASVGKRIFWANSKKQVDDPHLRFNLHVAQLRELLAKMEADPAIGGLRVNEALLDQVPQLREMLIAAGAKKAGGTTELLAPEAHNLYTSLLQDTAVPKVIPLIPTAPLVPIVKTMSTSGWDVAVVQDLLDSSVTKADSIASAVTGPHFTEWMVGPKKVKTTWWGNSVAPDGPMTVVGFTSGLTPADTQSLVTASLLQAATALGTHPDLSLAYGIVIDGSMVPTGAQYMALKPLFDSLGIKGGFGEQYLIARDDALAFLAKSKGDLANAGFDGGAALKIDWGIPAADPTATVTNLSAAYNWAPEKMAGLYTTGEVKMVAAGIPYQSIVWTDPAGAKAKALWTTQGTDLVWSKLDLFAQGQYSEAATAARQLHHLGDLLDLNPALDGIQIMGTVPSVAQKMAQDYGAVLDVTGNLRLTRLQALDLRDAIGASLPVKDATVYIGTLDNAMGYEASAVKALYDGAHITGSYTGSIVMHIGVYPAAAKYDVRLNEATKVLRMDAVDWGATTPTANERIASDLAALRFMAEQPGFDTVWIEAVSGLRWDVRDLLLSKGGQMKAERIVISKADLSAIGQAILPTPAAVAAVAAKVPDTVAGYDAAKVVAGIGGAWSPEEVAMLKNMVAGPIDAKIKSSKGALVLSTYGGGGEVIWRRLGNALEVHTADAATEQGLYAHLLRMADAMDKAPKIDALRFTTTSNVPEGFAALLKSAGAKEYTGGIRLTREQTLALRDQILHAADAGEASTATVVEAFVPKWLPAYGESPSLLGKATLTVVPQKQGFVKMLYEHPDWASPASVRVRYLSTKLVVANVSAPDALVEADVMFAYLRDIGHDLATHGSIDEVRFDNWADLSSGVRQAITDFGGSFPGAATHTLSRQNAIDMSAAFEADIKGSLGLGASVAEHAVAPIEAVTPSFAAAVHADAATVHEITVSTHWETTVGVTGSVWVGPDENMVIYKVTGPNDALQISTASAGTTGPEYLKALAVFAQHDTGLGLIVDKAALKGADGQAIWDALKAAGAPEDAGSLLLDHQALVNLDKAIALDQPLGPNSLFADVHGVIPPGTPDVIPTAHDLGLSLDTQFDFSYGEMLNLPKIDLSVDIGHGTTESLGGTKFAWTFSHAGADLHITVGSGPTEGSVFNAMAHALQDLGGKLNAGLLPDLKTLQVQLIDASTEAKAKALFEALGIKGDFVGQYTLHPADIVSFTEHFDGNVPLAKALGGSAVSAAPAAAPALADVLGPGMPDITGWGDLIKAPHTTAGTIDLTTTWPEGGVAWSISADHQGIVATDIVGAHGYIDPMTQTQMSLAMFKQWATAVDSGLGSGSAATHVLISGSATEGPLAGIAKAFGATTDEWGFITLSKDQLKAIGKAIDEQIVFVPGGVAEAAQIAASTAMHPAGWTEDAKSAWSLLKPSDTQMVAADELAMGLKAANGDTLSFIGHLDPVTKTYVAPAPYAIVNWKIAEVTDDISQSEEAVVWYAFKNATAAPLAGEELAGGIGATYEAMLHKAIATGNPLLIQQDVLDVAPGLTDYLKAKGYNADEMGSIGTVVMLQPEDVMALIEDLHPDPNPMGFIAAAKATTVIPPAPASTFLDEFITKAGAQKPKVVEAANEAIGAAKDTPMAQSFGKFEFTPWSATKYRASATTLTLKGKSTYGSVPEDLATIVLAGKKVDATPGMTTVVFESGYMDKANGFFGSVLMTSGHVTDTGGYTFSRDEFLALRDKVLADLHGPPAPVIPGMGPVAPTGDIVGTILDGTPKMWTQLASTGTNATFDIPGIAAVDNIAASPDQIVLHGLTWEPGVTTEQKQAAILAIASATDGVHKDLLLGEKVTKDPAIAALIKDHTIGEDYGITKVDLANVNLPGVPVVQTTAATREPLSGKLGWDVSSVGGFDQVPKDWPGIGKKRTLVWTDTGVPVETPSFAPFGQPSKQLRAAYRDYAHRIMYDGVGSLGTDAQRSAAKWKALAYLGDKAGAAGKPLFVSEKVIADDPKIGTLLKMYGAKEKALAAEPGTGLELTYLQAKKMGEDLASDANVGGLIAAPHLAAEIKTPEQIAKEAIADFTKKNGIGKNAPGSLLETVIDAGATDGVQEYKVAGKTVLTVQWSAGSEGVVIEHVEIVDPVAAVEMKQAVLGDFASMGAFMDSPLYIDDSAIHALGVHDDMGGLLVWSDMGSAWTTTQGSLPELKDYTLGLKKTPAGADLVKPEVLPPPEPIPLPVVEPPKPNGLADVYGYHAETTKSLATNMAADTPTLTTTEVSTSALTQTYDAKWANGVTVRYAEEQQGDARILRIRGVTGGQGQDQANALVAQIMGHAPTYFVDHPTVDRMLVNKSALTNTPGVAQMLKDGGWKETKDYYVLGRDKVGAFSTDLSANKSAWMSGTTIPTYVPGGGSVLLPTHPTPSFIYGYDAGAMKNALGTMVDKEIGAVELKAGEHGTAGISHEITVGRTKITWSVSPSGKTVGISNVTFAADATDHEKMVDVFAAMQKVAEDAGNRTGFFWIKPDVYVNTPSMTGLLKDVGGTEANYSALGEAIQMTSAQAKLLGDALRNDTMTGLTLTTQTTSEYLGFNKDLAKGFFFTTPTDKGRGVLEWVTGATGAAKKTTTQITRSADGLRAEIVNVTADESVRTMTVAGQLNWLVENGATDVTISPAVLGQVTKLDKWLLSVGAISEPGGMRLTDAALLNARSLLMHDALPMPLGGKALGFSFADEMITSTNAVIAAAHSEITGTALAKDTSTFVVNGHEVKSVYATSSGNIYWSAMDRGASSVSDERAAVVAQIRSFANQISQNASLKRLDVSTDLLRQNPGLRTTLKKYGATEVAATADHPAYLSLERGKALKLRADIEKELGSAGGDTQLIVGGQTVLINWPTTDELARTAEHVGGQQADKIVYADHAGNHWLFKPSATGAGAEADRAAAQLAAMIGVPVPPLRIYTMEIDGKVVRGSLQKWITDSHVPAKLSDLTPAQTEEMFRQSVLDWAVNNDDAHIENYLIDKQGNLWAVDKTRAYKSFGSSHDVLDTNSLGQGGTEALAPVLFKFWKDARRNPAVLSAVHPNTMVKTMRSLSKIDDATFRRLMEPVAALRAPENSRYAGNVEKMLTDMVARKNSTANDLADYFAKELRTIKANGGTLPKDWADWLQAGGKFNLDANPVDLLKERLAAHNVAFGERAAPATISVEKFKPVKKLMTSGYGGGVEGANAAAQAGAQVAGPGHVSARSYHYEAVIPTLRLTPEGSALADEWIARNEWLVLHALFDTDTSWVTAGSEWVAKLRKNFNPNTGTIRLIRSTNGYGSDPAANLAAYTRYGFRNLQSHALDRHFSLVGDGIYLYDDIRPEQFFTSMFGGFTAGEAEVSVRDMTIDQVAAIRPLNRPMSLSAVPTYSGPVVGGP